MLLSKTQRSICIVVVLTDHTNDLPACPKPFQDIKPEPLVILLCLVTDDLTGKE